MIGWRRAVWALPEGWGPVVKLGQDDDVFSVGLNR